MAFRTASRDFSKAYVYASSPAADAQAQRRFGGVILGCVAAACAFIIWTNAGGTGTPSVLDTQERTSAVAKADALRPSLVAAYHKLAAALAAHAPRQALSAETVAFFDSRFLRYPAGTFTRSLSASAVVADAEPVAPLSRRLDVETTQSLSPPRDDRAVPPPRALAAPSKRLAALHDDTAAPPPATAEKPSIFQRLFGKVAPLTLAYANPEDGAGALNDAQGMIGGRYDRQTAVYDISAHAVYLPDGTKLEAHSGLGAMLDDPDHTNIRMRGATPAAVYDLKLREAPFHGVRALRLIPVDEDKVYGRAGLLAHTYMLGPNGQSNGCVSFRNYEAFLQAYLSGAIKRLAVVERLL